MVRTCSASVGCARSFLPSTRYPSEEGPPIQILFLFEAAILSRMRSPVTRRNLFEKANNRGSLTPSRKSGSSPRPSRYLMQYTSRGRDTIDDSDPVRRPPVAVPVEGAVPPGLDDRDHHEQGEEEERRGQEQDDDRQASASHRVPDGPAVQSGSAEPCGDRSPPDRNAGLALMRSVALLPGRLHRLRGVLRRHGASRHLGATSLTTRPTEGPSTWS